MTHFHEEQTIHVAPKGEGAYTTITAALSSIPEDYTGLVTIFIHKGVYRERLSVTRPHVIFLGESADDTVITYDLYARMIMEDGQKRGTFRTYSCLIDTHDITFRNLTIANSAGKGPDVGQALAVYGDGDRLFFDNCRLLGGQDTLFTGPLPPKEIEVNGFVGPKQFAPRINGRHYYRNCYIEGDIDFIFGSATAYFEACVFFSKDIGRPINGYVTAASTPMGQDYGYVMKDCRFLSDCPPHTVYLGRPWREYAKTVLINCYMDRHIHPEGWNDWNKPEARRTSFYAEFGSFGPGADPDSRPDWIHRLKEEELSLYTPCRVLSGHDHWEPWAAA